MKAITLKVTERLIKELFAENCALVALLVDKNIISKEELNARKENFFEKYEKVFEALHSELDNPFATSLFEGLKNEMVAKNKPTGEDITHENN